MAVIAGNWKMHMTPRETEAFFTALDLTEVVAHNEFIIFPPVASLAVAAACGARDPRIQLGIQNMHWEEQGAFTGETSGQIAVEAGASFALIGHSERRHVFGETDAQVALKVVAARRDGLIPVICVGETLEERRAGRVDEVILRQLAAAVQALKGGEGRFLVAYEPVWAIGTGETATPEDAAAAHATLRAELESTIGIAAALRTPLLYGGSVNPANAADLLAAAEVDGVLVGGASLDAVSFTGIAAAGAG